MYAVKPKAPAATMSRNAVAKRVRADEMWARRWTSHEAVNPRIYPARTSRTATSWGGMSPTDWCWLKNQSVRPAKPINRRARTSRGGRGTGCPGGAAGFEVAVGGPEEEGGEDTAGVATASRTRRPRRG